jgi:threonylcarbamoyladenosine tRNA methylthiotransferase MtaB
MMNRKYDTKYYEEKINEIRKIRPNISITTDLIVGFPYETDEEFLETYEFLKKIEFTKIHTFPFSLRSGTKAEEMKEHFVLDAIKKERVHKVISLSNTLENAYYKKFIGKTLDVIVESSKDELSQGHTSNYILVHLDKKLEEGKMYKVLISDVDNTTVNGKVIELD